MIPSFSSINSHQVDTKRYCSFLGLWFQLMWVTASDITYTPTAPTDVPTSTTKPIADTCTSWLLGYR